jgi:hypothetical protein
MHSALSAAVNKGAMEGDHPKLLREQTGEELNSRNNRRAEARCASSNVNRDVMAVILMELAKDFDAAAQKHINDGDVHFHSVGHLLDEARMPANESYL